MHTAFLSMVCCELWPRFPNALPVQMFSTNMLTKLLGTAIGNSGICNGMVLNPWAEDITAASWSLFNRDTVSWNHCCLEIMEFTRVSEQNIFGLTLPCEKMRSAFGSYDLFISAILTRLGLNTWFSFRSSFLYHQNTQYLVILTHRQPNNGCSLLISPVLFKDIFKRKNNEWMYR